MPDRDGDRQILRLLAENGSDMTQPHHTIHYLYFKSEDSARQAAAQLAAQGYENIDIHPAPQSFWEKLFGPKKWSCVAEKHALMTEANVFAATDALTALAAQHGGDYDGWEAGLVMKD